MCASNLTSVSFVLFWARYISLSQVGIAIAVTYFVNNRMKREVTLVRNFLLLYPFILSFSLPICYLPDLSVFRLIYSLCLP
jgi:hypothetical protein